jgi:hypothetical protein
MRYHNGRLRNELDDTLCIRPKIRKVDWKEYVPFFFLALLIAGLLVHGLAS